MTDQSKQKKVILFALPGLHVGGIERHLIKQFEYFNHDKYEFHLLTFFHNKKSPDLYGQVPDIVEVHRFVFSPGFDVKNVWKLLIFLRSLRPDLVVSSMVFPNTLMRLLKPLVGYKIIAREHNTYTDKRFRHRLRDHICSYLSDALVAVSEAVADYASTQAWIPRDKFIVIQNGVDLEKIERHKIISAEKVPQLYREFNLSSEAKIILNVARIKPQKNHPLLIDAFAQFAPQHPGHVLFILGTGADEGKIRQKVEDLNLTGRVILAGYREDVYTFYAASKLFILTSDIEGFPNVAVEAMAFGLPILSTKVAGIDELVEDGVNGFLLERDSNDVAMNLSRLVRMDKNKFSQMQVKCEETAKKYSIKKNVGRYECLFDELLHTVKD